MTPEIAERPRAVGCTSEPSPGAVGDKGNSVVADLTHAAETQGVPTLLEDVQRVAERVRKAEVALDAEREKLYAAIRKAYAEGIPIARIARRPG
jgi:hypothetical protein